MRGSCLDGLAICTLLLAFPPGPSNAADVTPASQKAALDDAVERGDAFWRQIAVAEPRPASGCRQLLGYALVLCEARVHPERLERLLVLARQMQDQDPHGKNWGNLRWYWRDAEVTDANAVEFCIQDALLIHIRHGDWLPPAAKKELAELMRLGLEGCLRHRVPTDYTNIAILNAGNLIVLGQRFDRADAACEGSRRLDAICAWTAALGVHEFCSPTYYGTDLNGLLLIHAYGRGNRERRQAEALLQLFWTDIAANWFPAAQRLGGCHSRSYDYLRGLGGLDWHLWMHGWLESPSAGRAERCEPWTDEWSPPPALLEMGRRQFPRSVRQHWGILPAESRSHILYRDIALSCCGAGYGNQDSTLTVDLPGSRELSRCYFIPDGREDPYGKQKYETGPARHPKALHMQPFWAGVQRSGDALGLVIYRGRDLAAAEIVHVQSHFVLRRTADIRLDGKRLAMPATGKMAEATIPVGGSLVLRYGSAAVGVRVPWIVARGGGPAEAKLVDDGNAWNCLRLTIDHGRRSELEKIAANDLAVGAAFWVRVGSELTRDADFDAWRTDFDHANPWLSVSGRDPCRSVSVTVSGKTGPLGITAAAPWDQAGRVQLVPKPYQGVLEVDGKELGLPLLAAVEPLCSFPPGAGLLGSMTVPAGRAFAWEAESGLVLPGMAVGNDAEASGGRYVGQESSSIGQPSGSVIWSLAIERPGRYWLWARVRSVDARRPPAGHGKFSFQVIGEEGAIMPAATWSPQPAGAWQWQPLTFDEAKLPAGLDLSKGVYRIQVQTRRSGTMIDRLMLTADAKERP